MPKMNIKGWFAGFLLTYVASVARADDGVFNDKVIFGQTVGLSGQIAGAVKEMNEGAAAYIAMVNSQGGVYGRRIEIRMLDDRFEPSLALRNAEFLIRKERVFALFLTRGTPHTAAILPLLASDNVPLIAPSTGAAIFHKPVNKLIFNVRAKYQDEVAKAVEHFTTIGLREIGILHVDDAFGADALAGFIAAMRAHDVEPTLIGSFDREAPNIKASVHAALVKRPQALIIVGSATTTADLIGALRQQGSPAQIMTLSNNSSQSFLKRLGANAAGVIVSQITPAPNLLSSVLGIEFKNATKATGATVSYAAMEGFIAAKVLVEGLRRAGRHLTREGFMRGLESIHDKDIGGLTVSYGPNDHTGSEYVELTMVGRDGKFIR